MGPNAKAFYDHLAELCVGGARIVGLDANMALFGIIPEMKDRGVDMHLGAVHAEYAPDQLTWKWGSMAIWVVGPIPDPGQCMKIADHALAALSHRRQVDKTSTDLSKGFPPSAYKYSLFDPNDYVELDMNEKYSLLEADSKVFSGVLPLSTTMQHRVSCGVQAHKHRYELTFQMPAHDK